VRWIGIACAWLQVEKQVEKMEAERTPNSMHTAVGQSPAGSVTYPQAGVARTLQSWIPSHAAGGGGFVQTPPWQQQQQMQPDTPDSVRSSAAAGQGSFGQTGGVFYSPNPAATSTPASNHSFLFQTPPFSHQD